MLKKISILFVCILLFLTACGDQYRTFYKKGQELFENGKYREALAMFEKGHKKAPNKLIFQKRIAQCYYELDELNKAQELLKDYVKQNASDPEAYNLIGKTFPVSDYNAINYFQKALEIDPYYMESFRNMGLYYAVSKKYDLAIENLKKAHDIEPQNIDLYFDLAKTYYSFKRESFGNEFIKKALRKFPQEPGIVDRIEKTYKRYHDDIETDKFINSLEIVEIDSLNTKKIKDILE